jgi:hypothetical protein
VNVVDVDVLTLGFVRLVHLFVILLLFHSSFHLTWNVLRPS